MTTLKALHGKLYAGNPHVRFKKLLIILGAAVMAMCNYTSVAATPASSSSHTLVSAKRGCVASGRSSVAVLHRKERPGMIITFR
jgi:hypothetical protein